MTDDNFQKSFALHCERNVFNNNRVGNNVVFARVVGSGRGWVLMVAIEERLLDLGNVVRWRRSAGGDVTGVRRRKRAFFADGLLLISIQPLLSKRAKMGRRG